MSKQSLLVVDADPRSLRILELALRKAGFAVTTAADGAEALRKVQRSPPDLLLCELSLPGQDGVALCQAVRADERLAGLPVLLMNADRAQAKRAAALQAGADDFLLKPLLIKELVARIRVLLTSREQARNAQRGGAAALTGSVGDLGLVDLFTSLENWQKTATVFCESGDGRSARVWVRDGQVLDAEVDPLSGEAAFFRLLNWGAGSFRVEFGPVDREPRSDAGTQALLMEGMRRIDEMGRMAETLPFSTVLGVDFAALAAQLAEMPDELNGVLRLFDGQRTLREVLSDSPLDDLSTMGAVQRLMSDGVLAHGGSAAQRPKPSLQKWLVSTPPPPVATLETPPDAAPAPAAPAASPAAQTRDTPPAVEREAAAESPGAGAAARDRAPPSTARDRISTPVSGAPTARQAGPIALIRYPPLRGTRRERLRRETEEARQGMSAGRPVRLTHVLELPATPGGGDAMPQGARRMSVAVGEAAKRFAPDLPVSRVVRPWMAPGARPDTASEEISSALADAVATTQAGAAPLDAQPRAGAQAGMGNAGKVNPGGLRESSSEGSGRSVLGALRPARPSGAADPDGVPTHPTGPGAVDARGKVVGLRLAVAGLALVGLAATAFLLRRSPRSPAARPAIAEPQAAPAAVPAPPEPAVVQEAPATPVATTSMPAPDPNEYARALASGDAQLKRGKYRAAIAEFRKAVALRPDSVPALLALGDAYLEGDQLRNAVKPLQQAAQLDPKNARAHLLLGTVFQGLTREKEAVVAYRHYLELEPHGEFAGDVRAIVANLSR